MSGFNPTHLGLWGRLWFSFLCLACVFGVPGLMVWSVSHLAVEVMVFAGFITALVSGLALFGACELTDWILKGRDVDNRRLLAKSREALTGGEVSEFNPRNDAGMMG